MSDPSYPAFLVVSFIASILVVIPLPWHLQAWNSGTCLYMIWTAIGCLNAFINSIVWHNNAIDWAPLWCDISTRLAVGVSVAIPAASLCINRRLYKIASCDMVMTTRAHKRRAVLVDLAIGLGIPALQMPLQFIVQGHRYDIFEDIGCLPTTVNTPAAYPLTFVWPNVISLVSSIYCVLTLIEFMKRRAQFSQFVNANSSLTLNRYFRLMSLATIEIVFSTPLTAYGLYLNITTRPIYPWKSWSDLHYAWYIIDTYPAILWRGDRTAVVLHELSRWSIVFCALLFFAFFGFADEAQKNYKRAYQAITHRLGIEQPVLPTSKPNTVKAPVRQTSFSASLVSIPSFKHVPLPSTVPDTPSTKRDSFSSSADRTSYHRSDYTDSIYAASTLQESPRKDSMQFPSTPASSQSAYEFHDVDHMKTPLPR